MTFVNLDKTAPASEAREPKAAPVRATARWLPADGAPEPVSMRRGLDFAIASAGAIRDLDDALDGFGGHADDETPAQAVRRLLESRDGALEKIRELLAPYDLEGSDAVDDVRLFVAATVHDFGEIRDIIGLQGSDDEGALTDLVREKIAATKAEIERLAVANAGLRARAGRAGEAIASVRGVVMARGGFQEQESTVSAVERLLAAGAEAESRLLVVAEALGVAADGERGRIPGPIDLLVSRADLARRGNDLGLRAEMAEAGLLRVAEALGRVHEADGHASKPASVDVLVERIRELEAHERRARKDRPEVDRAVENAGKDLVEALREGGTQWISEETRSRMAEPLRALACHVLAEGRRCALREIAPGQAPSAPAEHKVERPNVAADGKAARSHESIVERLRTEEERRGEKALQMSRRGSFSRAAKHEQFARGLRFAIALLTGEAE